jgi:hypothetical protein
VLLCSVSYKTSAQKINVDAIRKANETKQQLDSCQSFGLIVTQQRNAYIDSTSERNTSIKQLTKDNKRLTKRRNFWRKATGISVIITIITLLL